jgi:YfiH family protein
MPDAKITVLSSGVLRDAGFVHGFSTRLGGVSKPPFDAADFALLRDRAALRENIARFAREVGFEPARLQQAQQVHGARVLITGDANEDADADSNDRARAYEEADALVATRAGDAVGVRVADCVPVLVGDAKSGRVAAIHAGWKGVVGGVVRAGVNALDAHGDLFAAIGPCIGACCFEVSEDVARKIADASTDACIIRHHVPEKAMVDLRIAVAAQLGALGLSHARIDQVAGCTRCETARFYSYRRDGDDAGRLLAVIAARKPC